MKKRKQIAAKCQLYACRICRTKTGWPHQPWCEAGDGIKPGCEDCIYYYAKIQKCVHPVIKAKERIAK